MKTLKERVAIEQRAADGELLQWTSEIYPEWQTMGHSVGASFVFWWEEKDYRIKPKPLELWVNVYDDGIFRYHSTRAQADMYLNSGNQLGGKTIRMVQADE